jgi:hypothetical protein
LSHQQKKLIAMTKLTRNNRLVATVVALLLSVSAVGTSMSAAAGTPEHPPVMAVAILPAAPRLQRDRRYWALRSIRLRLVRQLREVTISIGRRARRLRPRLPAHEWFARGPPREPTQRV